MEDGLAHTHMSGLRVEDNPPQVCGQVVAYQIQGRVQEGCLLYNPLSVQQVNMEDCMLISITIHLQ